jgi:hypothetical protein
MIKIEVTGNSIPEVADKLLAIGASLRASAAVEIPRGSTKVEAEGNAPQKSNTPKSVPAVEATDSQPTTAAPSSTPAPATSVSEELEVVDLPVVETPALDFNADIRGLALQLVKKRDKAALEKILIHFGVERASQVEPARMPELLAMIKAALG